MKNVLIHRYDNAMDIKSVATFGCSEVYDRSINDDFEMVIIVPTLSAHSNIAIAADAASRQYPPTENHPWPGRAGLYKVRVDLTNFRRITASRVRLVAEAAGVNWMAQWKVQHVCLDDNGLFAARFS